MALYVLLLLLLLLRVIIMYLHVLRDIMIRIYKHEYIQTEENDTGMLQCSMNL